MERIAWLSERSLYWSIVALVFLLGNGSIELLLPNAEMSVGGDIRRSVILVAILLGLTLLFQPAQRIRVRQALDNPLLVLLLILDLAALISPNRWNNLKTVSELVVAFLFSLSLCLVLKTARDWSIVLSSYGLGVLFVVIDCIQGYRDQHLPVFGNSALIKTALGDSQATTIFLVASIPLLLFLPQQLSGWRRISLTAMVLALAGAGLLLLNPVLLGIGLLFSFAYLFRHYRTRGHGLVMVILILFLLGLGSFILGVQTTNTQLHAAGWLDLGRRLSELGLEEWATVVAVGRDYPLSGIGPGKDSLSFLLPRYHHDCENSICYPRSFYSHWLICFGFLGLVSLVILFRFLTASPSRWATTAPDRWGAARLSKAALIAFLSPLILFNPCDNDRLIILMWFLIGCVAAAQQPQFDQRDCSGPCG